MLTGSNAVFCSTINAVPFLYRHQRWRPSGPYFIVERQVSVFTQHHAVCEVGVPYRRILERDSNYLEDMERAKQLERLPVVLSRIASTDPALYFWFAKRAVPLAKVWAAKSVASSTRRNVMLGVAPMMR
jgi:hypothetical protein